MIYVWRTLAVLAGVAVIAAATHANVLHAGGYETSDSWLVITIAVLLALGAGYCAIAWGEGHKIGAVLLGLCLVSGEVYWLLTNAEREIAKRDELAAPLRDASVKYAAAEKRVEEARAALATAGERAQARVSDALKAKQAADAAAVSEAAKPGCRKNCVDLLKDAKDRAESELREARARVDAARSEADVELKAAETALAALPIPRNASPLPTRLGFAPWAWDLVMAALRSLAVVGGSIAVALALHPHRKLDTAQSDNTAPKQSETAPAPVMLRKAQPKPALKALPRPDDQEHVAAFLRAVLRPDPEGSASLRRLYGQYPEWCEARDITPLPAADLGKHLRTIVDAIGLEVEPEGKDMVVRGAALAA
jgi:hypothetical protein